MSIILPKIEVSTDRFAYIMYLRYKKQDTRVLDSKDIEDLIKRRRVFTL